MKMRVTGITAGPVSIVKPCPFCNSATGIEWLSKPMNNGPGASGMEAPMRALGCRNPKCKVQPQTRWRETEEYIGPGEKRRQGYHSVNHDAEAISDWNDR